MEADEIVFIPKYPIKFRVVAALSPPMAAAAVAAAWAEGDRKPLLYVGVALFVVLPPLFWLRTYRRIRFGREIRLERFLLPPRTIRYASIQDYGFGVLKTSQGTVSLQNCENFVEFGNALKESETRGYWNESQLKGELPEKQVASWRATMIAAPVAVVLTTAFVITHPIGLRLHPLVWFMAIYVPLGLGLYAHYRRRAD